MNGNGSSVTTLLSGILTQASSIDNAVDVAVFPPSLYIQKVVDNKGPLLIGGQDLSEHADGAYTGEISASMLKDVGCSLVLVGHSERRTLFGDSNQRVAAKFKAAQQQDITPVLCVGETLEQREAGETLTVIAEQLSAVVEVVGLTKLSKAIIAYEPVWAIGTGKTATAEQAQQVHAAIRHQLTDGGVHTRILYGGSVKSSNAAELFAQPDIDGALVGGASLDAEEFNNICNLAKSG